MYSTTKHIRPRIEERVLDLVQKSCRNYLPLITTEISEQQLTRKDEIFSVSIQAKVCAKLSESLHIFSAGNGFNHG